MSLECNVSVAAYSDYDEEASITMEVHVQNNGSTCVCTSRHGDDVGCNDCTDYFLFPSPGEMLKSEAVLGNREGCRYTIEWLINSGDKSGEA